MAVRTAECEAMLIEIERLRAALDEIISPLAYMRKRAEADGCVLNDMAYSIANSVAHLQSIAGAALWHVPARSAK